MEKMWLERQITLIGEEKTDKLIGSSVMIFGIGGVGSFTAEAISRCGVGKIILVDFDTVSLSNINRQLIADTTTIGKKKTSVMAERIKNINPDCTVIEKDVFVTAENAVEIIKSEEVDYVIDAIDNVTAKIAIIEYCKANNISIISSMGTGNKLDPFKFKIADIQKTSVCPLARVMRYELKKRNVTKVDVLYSEEELCKSGERVPASISFVPSVAGLLIARHVILKLTDSKNEEK
ncbi:MAG: tRNA threonylcarbamoyladenosine dehydratase [Ruminococcaceae bacterium]|nr:tRNA threonylcarbamoyladenosine dehydratase [Oscillospiraceae bacterium]